MAVYKFLDYAAIRILAPDVKSGDSWRNAPIFIVELFTKYATSPIDRYGCGIITQPVGGLKR